MSVLVDWLEDTPTRGADGGNFYGQHGRLDGQPVLRMLWPDGTPCDGDRGQWHPCSDCGADGALIQEGD